MHSPCAASCIIPARKIRIRALSRFDHHRRHHVAKHYFGSKVATTPYLLAPLTYSPSQIVGNSFRI